MWIVEVVLTLLGIVTGFLVGFAYGQEEHKG